MIEFFSELTLIELAGNYFKRTESHSFGYDSNLDDDQQINLALITYLNIKQP